MRRIFAAALGAACMTAPAGAQTPQDTIPADSAIAMEELVVRAARPSATSGGVSALEVRLDSMRLAPAPTLEEVLRALPLVQVRANSRGEAQLSLRGAESRQVAVLMDGVPLTLGWDHRTDLGVVPMAAAQSITLLRGLPSVLHGPNVLGGVVEVGVARGPRGPLPEPRVDPLRMSAEVDHLGGRTVGAVAAQALEPGGGTLVVRGGAGYRERPGFALPGALGAEAAGGGGLRENSDSEQVDGFVAARWRAPAGAWLSASASGYRAERGVPPELHTSSPRLWRYPLSARMLAAVSGGTGQRETPLGTGDLEASLGVDVGRTEIDSYRTRAYDVVEGTEDADDRTVSLRLLGDHTLGPRAELRGALTLAEVAHREVIDGGAPARYRQRLWSLGSEIAWRIPAGALGGRLTGGQVTAGFAWDGADTPETGGRPALERLGDWGGRLGINALAADGALLLHAGISRRARFPSLRELYSGALGRFVPNPELRPERLTAGEAGVTTRVAGVQVQAVAFHQRLSDAIVRAGTGDGRYRRENRDEMRSTGVELLTGWRLGPTTFTADLTVQRVRVLDPTAPGGERRAEYQPTLAGQVDWSAPLPLEARANVGVGYMGRQWCVHPDLDREVVLDPSTRVDVGLARSWGPVETTLALENAADAAVYDQCGLPQPGRMLRLRIRLR